MVALQEAAEATGCPKAKAAVNAVMVAQNEETVTTAAETEAVR
jgi:hypothetical protein